MTKDKTNGKGLTKAQQMQHKHEVPNFVHEHVGLANK